MFSKLTAVLLFAASCFPASAGVIYVADYGTIYKYSANGTATTFGTGAGNTNLGIGFDTSGDLFVDSRDSYAIYKYTPQGVQSTFATAPSSNLLYGLAVNTAGDVFTGNDTTGTILEYTPAGVSSTFATGTDVTSLAFDPLNGNLFEADGSGDIYEYSSTGVRTTFASGVPTSIFGLTFDASGDLYASNWNGQIVEYTPAGAASTFASFSNQILPTGLAYDYASGTLYMTEVKSGVSSPGQQVVDEFNSSGVESTFATGLYVPYGIADLQPAPVSAAPEPGTLHLGAGAMLLAPGLRRVRRRRP
jgi:hypothetical protein